MFAPVRRLLEKGGRGGVFFLHGDDEFRKDEAVRAIVEEHLDPATRDFNFDVLRAGEVDGERLASVLATPPMMADWRVVVVRDVESVASNARTRALLVELASAPPVGMAVVLIAAIPKGSGARFWKDLKAKGRSLELPSLSPDDVPGWLMERARETLGIELEEEAALTLSAAIGSDLGVLAQELQKLSTVVEDGVPIKSKDVEAAGFRLPVQDRWQWFDLVGERRFAEALAGLPILLGQGESGVGLAIQLGSQILRIGVALEGGRAALEAVLPPHQRWLARRLAPQAQGWTVDQVSVALAGLLRADRLMKASGASSETLLEEWLLGLLVSTRAAA